jgi:tetratricopeptide (TPR) repeat protein
MASKRSKKGKKRQKALQRWRQRAARTRRPLTQIPPENADQVAMTTTGELLQLIRLHYEVHDIEQFRTALASVRCIDYDASQRRWVWLYTEEAKTLPFHDRRAAANTVLGEFVHKGPEEVVLNLRSFERALHAITFFDTHMPRTVARITAATVSNRLLSVAEAASLGSLDQYFDHAEVIVKDPESFLQALHDRAPRTPDAHERFALVEHAMAEYAQAPVPAMERLPLHYYEDGLRAVEALLSLRKVLAMQRWHGNTEYTLHDVMRDLLRQGERHAGTTTPITTQPPAGASPLTAQLYALMQSESYEDWLQAWELLRDHTPDHITTFAALEALFDLPAHGGVLSAMFHDLDMALHNAGLEDARLTAQRADIARWVYTHFPEEPMGELGNFRGYEAESRWDLGQREQAEALFQELTATFPTFVWGYIWWGDQYWLSDWSYGHAPDYDRAAALYRQALAQADGEDRNVVQDRLDDLQEERVHPEQRERRKQVRLQHMQRRTGIE